MGTLLGFVLCFRCFFTVTGPFVSVLIRSVEAVQLGLQAIASTLDCASALQNACPAAGSLDR